MTCRSVILLHVQAALGLSRLSHERPEYLWLVLRKPSEDDRSPASSEPAGELRVRLQWTSAPLSVADTAGQNAGFVSRLVPPMLSLAVRALPCCGIFPLVIRDDVLFVRNPRAMTAACGLEVSYRVERKRLWVAGGLWSWRCMALPSLLWTPQSCASPERQVPFPECPPAIYTW